MSRCFPFPPPGYEKKAKNNDLDLLTKDKHKEKKHKKEKRDKEERKGKEKKDKERNKDKHKEKKDRKEKHKDKKKSKDRNKDKNRTSDERKIEGQLEGCNGQKLGETSQRTEEIRNHKLVEELGKRIRDGGTENQIVKNFIGNGQIRTEGMRGMVEEGVSKQTEEKKQIMDKKEEKKQIQDKKEEEKQIKDKKGDRRADGSRNKNESQSMGNAVVPNFSGVIQKRVEELARLVEKDTEKKMEGNQKNKEKKGDDKRVGRHKDRDREKKSKSKDKDRDKEKKKKEKVKQKNDSNGFLHGESLKKDKEKEKQKNDTNGFLNGESLKKEDNSLNVSTGSEKITPTEENLRKRKNSETNGLLHDGEIRPNKLPRLLSSSHFLTGNGGKLDPQSVIQCAFNKQGAANNKTENKINGIIETQQFSSFSTKPSLATVQAKENGEVCTKPSHPDSKYLSKVLSIPKPEEYSDFDDQEWLFRSDDPRRKKPKAEFSGSDGPPQVWDKALRIESDDVCALPYVIPY